MPAYKNERGSWNVKFYYTDWTGNRKQKKKEGFTTKREALEFEHNFLNSCEKSPDITFRNLVDHYLKDSAVRLKLTTLESKQYTIETKLIPYFGDTPISDIDVLMVRKWQNELINSENHYADTYLKSIHNQLSAIMNFAVKYYHLPFNPAARCGSMGKKQAEHFDFWTKDEFYQFVSYYENDPKLKAIFYLLFFTGMRKGELYALTLLDFDFDKNTVSITKNTVKTKKKKITHSPKTKKSVRTITVPAEVMQMVETYSKMLYDYNPTTPLFPVSSNYLRNKMEQGCKKTGVKKIRVHDLRHSHASLLIELGISPLLISERLGHENIQTTLNTYSHLYPNKQQEIAQTLSSLI